ncbi:MAG: PIG-L family deacetylase [Acidobacteriota bacterium]
MRRSENIVATDMFSGQHKAPWPAPVRRARLGGWLAFGLVCGLALAGLLAATPGVPEDEGVTGFGLALRKLPKTASVLYITAHPDDEDNALLVRLSRGEGYRVGLLTLTRGEGGQNEIGSELGEDLGVLRTQELEAVHRFDGVEQFFSRARDFGYSFSVEETFQKWGRQEILGDIVRVIRLFRPSVVITLQAGGAGGGQHHQASAQLAVEACRLAGDPAQFPEQLNEGLRPWRPYRVFQMPGPGMGGGGPAGDVALALGEYDPLLGETWLEFGARARGRHLSQGMAVLPEPDPLALRLALVSSRIDATHLRTSLFDQMRVGLDALTEYDPSLESAVTLLDGYVAWAQESFRRSDWETALRGVLTGLEYVRRVRSSTSHPEALFLLDRKEEDFLNAVEKGSFLYADALIENSRDAFITPGETFRVRVRCLGRTGVPLSLEAVELVTPPGWTVEQENVGGDTWRFQVHVPEDTAPSGPFWTAETDGRNRVDEGFAGIEAERPPAVRARIRYRVADVPATVERPVEFRWFDRRLGRERRRRVEVAPRVSASVQPRVIVFRPGGLAPREVEVRVVNWSGDSSEVGLRWEGEGIVRTEPREARLQLGPEGGSRVVRFRLFPDAKRRPGQNVFARVVLDGASSGPAMEVRDIDYPHIEGRLAVHPAQVTLVPVDVVVPRGLQVGYVMGVGDEVGEATRQLGANVTFLEERDLAEGDLSRFDAIVLGVRALLVRRDLADNFDRLLEYVRSGGHLVVQYHKYEILDGTFAPYPFTIHRPHDRVTVEDSPVEVLVPGHPLFQRPNRIQAADWEGWVQERGLYFWGSWDERYVPLLELQDPWPYNAGPKRGALLVAEYGSGTYVYTGLAFFRQLPAGVPGAYRLWANLISLGRVRRASSE